MIHCCVLSYAIGSSGRNFWRSAFAVSSADVVVVPFGRVREEGADFLARLTFIAAVCVRSGELLITDISEPE